MAETRVRVSITIPKDIVDMIPKDINFSRCVSELLYDNLERISTMDTVEIEEKKKKIRQKEIAKELKYVMDDIIKTHVDSEHDTLERLYDSAYDTLMLIQHAIAQYKVLVKSRKTTDVRAKRQIERSVRESLYTAINNILANGEDIQEEDVIESEEELWVED